MDDKLIVHKLPDFETVEVYGVCDGHIGDPKTDEQMFKDFVKHIGAEPNRYWVYNGDNINNALKSSVSNVYNEKYPPGQQKLMIIDILRPIAHKCLAFVPGNHESRSSKEADCAIVLDIAMILCGEDRGRELYRENEAVVKIQFGSATAGPMRNLRPLSYIGLITHGFGGGAMPATALNNMYKHAVSFADVDFTISGHVHKGILSGKFARRVIDVHNDMIKLKHFCVLVNGAWADYGGYAARKGYPPSAKGAGRIILHNGQKDISILT